MALPFGAKAMVKKKIYTYFVVVVVESHCQTVAVGCGDDGCQYQVEDELMGQVLELGWLQEMARCASRKHV